MMLYPKDWMGTQTSNYWIHDICSRLLRVRAARDIQCEVISNLTRLLSVRKKDNGNGCGMSRFSILWNGLNTVHISQSHSCLSIANVIEYGTHTPQ